MLKKRKYDQVIWRSGQNGCIYVLVFLFTLHCHELVIDHVLNSHDSRPGPACFNQTGLAVFATDFFGTEGGLLA